METLTTPVAETNEFRDSVNDEISEGVNDTAAQFKRCSAVTGMIRGDLGFGRKVKKGTLDYLSQWGPIDTHHYSIPDDQTIITTTHITEPILLDNRRQRLSGQDGYSPSREWRRAASIPLGDYAALKALGIDIMDPNDRARFLALLDSSAGLKYRTAPGRLSKGPVRETFVPRSKQK